MNVFLSYSRLNAAIAAAVAEDIRHMGHTAWFDREVVGGQAWWSTILRQIRECDLCVLVLTPQLQDSHACRAEYTYALQLNRTILPVLCHDGVKINQLPPELSKIQYVDYRAQDKQAAFSIVKAIQAAPKPAPLPHPLPPEPPAPMSYLGDLRAQIDSDRDLNFQMQRDLLYEVKRRLSDRESAADARDLLRLLRSRQDLFANVAEEIDAILSGQLRSGGAGAYSSDKAKPESERRPFPESDSRRRTVRYAESAPGSPPPLPGQANSEQARCNPIQRSGLTGDIASLELLIKEVAMTSKSQALRRGEASVRISVSSNELSLVASFPSGLGNEWRQLRNLDWNPVEKGPRVAALIGFILLVIATYGLGGEIGAFIILLAIGAMLVRKDFRDYLNLNRNRAVKRFPLSQARQAAESILQCFRVLGPESRGAAV
jgi:hypothetical protein